MAGLLADHAGQWSAPGEDPHALSHQHLGIPSAHRAEPEEAVIVDVVDDQADLVDVAEHGKAGRAVLVRDSEARAQPVVADGGKPGRVLAPHAGRQPLVAARPGRVQQAVEELL